MHGPRIILASLLLLLEIASATTAAQESSRSRLYRTLIRNRESAKLRLLTELEKDSEECARVVVDLIAAVNAIAEKAAAKNVAELPASTVRLIQLIGSVSDPAAVESLVKLLDASRIEIAMVSAETLGQNDRREALSALIGHTERPEFTSNYAFRFSLLKSIAQIGDADGVEFLTKLLPTLDGQLAHEIDKFLDQVARSDFQGDQDRFDAWKNGDWRQVKTLRRTYEGDDTSSEYRLEPYPQPDYYGIGIHAERLVFVLDHSSSMSDQGRLQQAKRELARAIRSLSSTTKFTIIFYETTVRVWQKGLVEATVENKNEAVRFLDKIYPGHDTNTYGALEKALHVEENIEAIFLASDGAPTAGAIVAPAKIIVDISRQNRFRHIMISTVGISIEGSAEDFMRELAAQNGGEYRGTQ